MYKFSCLKASAKKRTPNLNKIIFLTLFTSLALAATPKAMAQNTNEVDPVAIYKQAGIDAQQEATIRKFAQEYDQENVTKLQSLGQMLQDLRDMAYQKSLNESAMIAKQEEINKLQSDMSLQRIKLVIKIRNLLTPEQNEKLVIALQNRMKAEESGKLR